MITWRCANLDMMQGVCWRGGEGWGQVERSRESIWVYVWNQQETCATKWHPIPYGIHSSVLQCVAECCSAGQCVTVDCDMLPRCAVHSRFISCSSRPFLKSRMHIYILIHTYTHKNMYIYKYIYTYMYMYIYVYIYKYIYTCVCMYVYIGMCMYNVYIYTSMICVHMNLYTFLLYLCLHVYTHHIYMYMYVYM